MTPQEARTLGEAFRKEMRRLFQEQQCVGPYGPHEQRDPIKFALTEFGTRVFAGICNALEGYADELDAEKEAMEDALGEQTHGGK